MENIDHHHSKQQFAFIKKSACKFRPSNIECREENALYLVKYHGQNRRKDTETAKYLQEVFDENFLVLVDPLQKFHKGNFRIEFLK